MTHALGRGNLADSPARRDRGKTIRDTGRRWPSANPGERNLRRNYPYWHLDLWPWSLTLISDFQSLGLQSPEQFLLFKFPVVLCYDSPKRLTHSWCLVCIIVFGSHYTYLVKVSPAGKWPNQDLNPGQSDSEACYLWPSCTKLRQGEKAVTGSQEV